MVKWLVLAAVLAASLGADLQVLLQEAADAVVSRYLPTHPNISVSVAWQDALHNASAASGFAFGRPVTPDDTFLYGSGTKPFTAAAVLRLLDSGAIDAEDKAHAHIDPYLRSHGHASLVETFGPTFADATVLDLIRMAAGIRDFEDSGSFDHRVLQGGGRFWNYPYEAMNYSVSQENRGSQPPLYFSPGAGVAYSSTSYEVAGLLLVALLQPDGQWFDFDLRSALFSDLEQYASLSFPPHGDRGENLSERLTIPGYGFGAHIFEQDASILGWICGNLVARPADVVTFYRHILDDAVSPSLLSDASRAIMRRFAPATAGWNAGQLQYGAGLEQLFFGSTRNGSIPVQGHMGITYGFESASGYVPWLRGAFSVAVNVDEDIATSLLACKVLEAAWRVITGHDEKIGCGLFAHDILV